MSPPAPLWRPSELGRSAASLTRFAELASRRGGADLSDYSSLHRWSVDHAGDFWRLVWDFCEVRGEAGGPALLGGAAITEARWFPEARLNYAENLLRRRDDGVAIVFWGEDKVRRSLTWREVHGEVARVAERLLALGVGPGDRVAGYLPNVPEAAIAMLATSSLGAVWSSCSPDFGVQGVLERFGQIEPKVLFACDGYWFNGKRVDSMEKVRQVASQLPSVVRTVIVDYAGGSAPADSVPNAVSYAAFVAESSATEISFNRLPFNHPLFILYSSGTTGVPKCIVHGAGGTLLQHLKEHRLHSDVKPGDHLFYATTCGWMMWNWLMTGLASEATLILYDGSPLVGRGSILFNLADAEGITHFGTSAKFIDTVAKLGLSPVRTHRLRELRTVLSTGSPLAPESFDYVYREIKSDVCLSSISGGTDIVSCFVLGAPTLPVWRGELQCVGLGLSVKVFDESGQPVVGEKGELVCTRPFPSMPVCFWNDPDGAKYRSAYFARFPGVWCHGDYVEMTEHDGVQGMIIYGRSDATLKPGGVRIGTAEIYRQVEQLKEVAESLVIGQEWRNDTRIVLFVKLREGLTLDSALVSRIRRHLRLNASPAHVPAKVLQVGDIPRTKSNKIVELAVRNVVHGRPVRNLEALANPEALEHYRNRPELSEESAESEPATAEAEDSSRPPMHGIEYVEQGLASAELPLDFVPSLEKVRERVQNSAASVADQSAEFAATEALAADYVRAAFDALGWRPAVGENSQINVLAARLAVVPQHRKLFVRLLDALESEGLVACSGGQVRVVRERPLAAPDASQILGLFPQLRHEITLLSRCGAGLADVLRGRCDPLALLFPDGAADEMAALYRDSPAFGSLNALVPTAVEALIGSLPRHRAVRILELGAGTGGTTAHVLPHLDAARTEYFVTDVGAFFLTHAKESFGRYPFVRYAVLDVEKSLDTQNWQGGRFDLIIAANVLHATADLEQTLRTVRQLLTPGGALVLVEGNERRLWLDITFGLTEGWWRFSDASLRPSYPLIAPDQWAVPLRAAGFSSVTSAAPTGGMVMSQSIIVARADNGAVVASPARRHWLILADRRDTSERLAAILRARGHRCVTRIIGAEGPQIAEVLTAALTFAQGRLDGVIRLFGSESELERAVSTEELMQSAQRACTSVLELLHALLNIEAAQPPRLWLVTEDCVPAKFSRVSGVGQAPVRGLALAIGLEHPEFRCTHADLEREPGEPSVQAFCDELIGESSEDRVAFRGGSRFVARLAPWHYDLDGATARFSADGTYLITGGLGPLGLFFAQWMVEQGARHLALVGRGPPGEVAMLALERLRALGATLHVSRVDVSQSVELARLFEQLAQDAPPLAGVIHAAGVLDDGILRDQRWERFAPLLAPKLAGAWNLHLATREMRLDFFVLFSSTAAVLGHAGQANHAAANAFLDTLAHARRAGGWPALSINWGSWAQIGAASSAVILERLARQGIRPLAPELGLSALSRALAAEDAEVVVAAVDWREYEKLRGHSPLIQRVLTESSTQAAATSSFSSRLEAASLEARLDLLTEYVQAEVAKATGIDDAKLVGLDRGFFEQGMDSLSSVELRNRLQRGLGQSLPATLAFDYPNVEALVAFLREQVYGEAYFDESSQLKSSSSEFVQDPNTLGALRDAQTRIESLERAGREPIAIVGVACRLPGQADSPDAYWDLLAARRDAITPVPKDRWTNEDYYSADPELPGKLNISGGGFIDLPQTFDPEFFGIAPREALSLDPQQRLLLELSWEALENAGVAADRLNGREIGVFTAVCWNDYGQRLMGRAVGDIDAYMASGIANSMAAGRLSYVLGLHGPSLTIDTACSSSLVAVHLACQSLRNGECEAALVGGASQLLHPALYVNFTKARMLSPDNRCKTFDASANGFVRSEGSVVMVLKRLSDAIAANDNVLAVIQGSAVNHDGHTSGLTVPNGPAQQDVIRKALRAAGVAPSDVDYIESHGTGTALGDPIEVGALGAVFGSQPREAPLVVGAVKSNIGHLEAAAGLAGLLKVVLALRHETIPANLHFHNPNPHIDWARLPITVPVREQAWKTSARKRIAGISSFGFSGTNAHVVISEAPRTEQVDVASARSRHVLTLSARSESALATLASRYAARLSEGSSGVSLADVAFSANTGRAQFLHRLAVCADTARDAAEALALAARGEESPGVARGKVERGRRPRIAFLFSGQGSQYVGMGRALYESQPTFRAALERCDRILSEHHGIALLESLYGASGDRADVNATQITQPALFALEYALSELWKSWGVQPANLMGHSVGEYVAACVAGVFSLEDGLKLIAARGRLMGQLAKDGAMAAVLTDEANVVAAIEPFLRDVSIAAVNGPANIVISGRREAIEQIVARFTKREIKTVLLAVSHAFHSPLMEPMLAEFRAVAETIRFAKPRIEVISNLTGGIAGPEIATADYWCRHVRAPVRFAAGIQALHDRGCNTYIEMGPRPVLLGMGRQCVPEGATWLPSLRPEAGDWTVLLASVAALYVQGVSVDWQAFDGDVARKRVPLPNYPFERRRYWIEAPVQSLDVSPAPGARLNAPGNADALLGTRIPLAVADVVYTNRLRANEPAYLSDHVVGGRVLMPATGFIAMALAARSESAGSESGAVALEDLVFAAPLVLEQSRDVETQLVVAPDSPRAFRILSRQQGDDSWTLHASGRLAAHSADGGSEPLDIPALRASLPRLIEGAEHYERSRAAGFEFGSAFRGVKRIWRSDRVALGEIVLPEVVSPGLGAELHPALLDACLQIVATFVPAGGAPVVPLSISRLALLRPAGARLFSRATLPGEVSESGAITADVTLFDEAGLQVAQIDGFACRPMSLATLRRGAVQDTTLYDIEWRLLPRSTPRTSGSPGNWLIIADEIGYADALAENLRAAGARTCVASAAPKFRRLDEARCELDIGDRAQLEQLLGAAPGGGTKWSNIVHCGAIGGDSAAGPMSLEQLESSQYSGCASLLALAQAIIVAPASARAGLAVVTRGVHSVSGEGMSAHGIAGATAWGLSRVIASENPDLRCIRIDLDANSTPAYQAAAVSAELLSIESGEEIALRAGAQRYVARLAPHAAEVLKSEAPAGPVRLEASSAGVLEELRWVPLARRAPGPGEVEIEVRATGLGFRDVLSSLGMYPGGPVSLGCECAGVVMAAGSDVTHVRVGDAVVAVAYGSFATHVTVPSEWAVRLPDSISFAQAAAIPSSFLTADYALRIVAHLAPKQRVLIHAGAGGVGQAAIQVALRAGAEVFATAGSVAKRAYLTSMGVHHTFDSRSTAFADEILRITAGRGVDVVLNSLADEFIERSFAVLADEGCFVEIGKRGILSAAEAAKLKPRARYVVVDLGEVSPQQPALIQTMLAHIVEGFKSGAYVSPPVTSFSIAHASEAFRHMARARHTGKIVVNLTRPEISAGTVRADGTYLVTGGLGALGLEVVRSLAARGARHLVLLGRRTPDSASATVVAGLQRGGVSVRVVSANVADADSLNAALSEIRTTMPPLRGVVHAAGVVDDGVIAQQTWGRCEQVIAPKVYGAWNLHLATRKDALDFFVLFSAAAGVLGIPGQGSYAAANVFLDALAHFRRAQGQPATSIDWGAWDQLGMAQSPDAVRSLSARGLQFMPAAQGIDLLWRTLAEDPAQRVVLPIDWNRFRDRVGNTATPLLSECYVTPAAQAVVPAAAKEAASSDLTTRLAQAPKQARSRIVMDVVVAQIRKTIGLAPDQRIDDRQPLQELGLDSLMAVELRNALAAVIGRPLPATFAFDYPSSEAITKHLLTLLLPEEAPAPSGVRSRVETPVRVSDAAVAALSDDEAAELLLQELDGVAKE